MLSVGSVIQRAGNITTLSAIGARPPRDIETNLGYEQGRLALGFWVLLLKTTLSLADFELDGTTLRSGGREGKPAATQAEDLKRPRVHNRILDERGSDGYAVLQKLGLSSIQLQGWNRLAKVVPVSEIGDVFSPATAFPIGGGFLQWRLRSPQNFLVAMFVDRDCVVSTPQFVVDLQDGLPHQIYDKRARVVRYLEAA